MSNDGQAPTAARGMNIRKSDARLLRWYEEAGDSARTYTRGRGHTVARLVTRGMLARDGAYSVRLTERGRSALAAFEARRGPIRGASQGMIVLPADMDRNAVPPDAATCQGCKYRWTPSGLDETESCWDRCTIAQCEIGLKDWTSPEPSAPPRPDWCPLRHPR